MIKHISFTGLTIPGLDLLHDNPFNKIKIKLAIETVRYLEGFDSCTMYMCMYNNNNNIQFL